MNPNPTLLPAALCGVTPLAIHSDSLAGLFSAWESSAKIRQLDIQTAPEADPMARTTHKYVVGADGIATIPLQGMMLGAPDDFLDYVGYDYTVTPHLTAAIAEALTLSNVKAIVIDANSPGGVVTGLQALYEVVANANKPVLVAASGLLCSAALYAVAGATEITADPTTFVGSIGTMTTITDVSAMLNKLGIQVHLIASGNQKGTGTPGVAVTDERKRPMQAIVDELAAQFKAAVAAGRGLDPAQVDALATGEAWLATRALTLGLIDSIATNPMAAASLTAKESLMLSKEQYKALIAAHPNHMSLIDQLDANGKDLTDVKAAVVDAEHQATAAKATQLEARLTAQATEHAAALKTANEAAEAIKVKLTAAEAKLAKITAGSTTHDDVGTGDQPPATALGAKTDDEVAAMSPLEKARHFAALAAKNK